MSTTNELIGLDFSSGNFEKCYPFLADDISWEIVGDKTLSGKEKVMEFCMATAAYFTSVTTQFNLGTIITSINGVAITGSALFINKENKQTNISSCDVYQFESGKLKTITSYCIVINKN